MAPSLNRKVKRRRTRKKCFRSIAAIEQRLTKSTESQHQLVFDTQRRFPEMSRHFLCFAEKIKWLRWMKLISDENDESRFNWRQLHHSSTNSSIHWKTGLQNKFCISNFNFFDWSRAMKYDYDESGCGTALWLEHWPVSLKTGFESCPVLGFFFIFPSITKSLHLKLSLNWFL